MPPDSTARSRQPRGDELEALTAEVWFWEGYFTRRSVNLTRHYAPEPLQITDLDLLALGFDPRLRQHRLIGEAKGSSSRSAPKPLDRVIWLRGLRELVGAEGAELVTAMAVSSRTRRLASTLGVTVQTLSDLERRRQTSCPEEAQNSGSQGVDTVERLVAVRNECRADPDLERAFWFLRSDVWFLEPWQAAKQTIGLIQELSTRWAPGVDDVIGCGLPWLFSEALAVFAVSAVTLAGYALQIDNNQFREAAGERLAEGIVPPQYQARISDAVDTYVAGLLAHLEAPSSVRADALGAFTPQPPAYWEPIVELVERLTRRPVAASQLPRQVDFLASELLVRRREPDPALRGRLGIDEDALRMVRQIVAFLKGQAGLPAEIASGVADIRPLPPQKATRSEMTGAANESVGVGNEVQLTLPDSE